MVGWLPLYVVEEDLPLLLERLNSDPEIAFFTRDGESRWRAVWQVDDLHGKTMLWHVPGGPLPLLHPGGEQVLIKDPFAGWQELRPGRDRSVPYFGPSWLPTLLLRLWTPGWNGLPEDLLPISGFEWYGRNSSRSPPPETQRWWNRLRRWVGRRAVRVTREGPLHGSHADIWAMPAALRAIKAGLERMDNPWLA